MLAQLSKNICHNKSKMVRNRKLFVVLELKFSPKLSFSSAEFALIPIEDIAELIQEEMMIM